MVKTVPGEGFEPPAFGLQNLHTNQILPSTNININGLDRAESPQSARTNRDSGSRVGTENGTAKVKIDHKPGPLPPISFLKECFSYDPDTGILMWKRRPRHHFSRDRDWRTFNTTFSGRQAGRREGGVGGKYIKVTAGQSSFRCHRAAWAIHYGVDPYGALIDHINNDGTDNRIANLRLATFSQNGQNQKAQSNSKLKGVTLCRHRPNKK